jgi:hypothetical protein
MCLLILRVIARRALPDVAIYLCVAKEIATLISFARNDDFLNFLLRVITFQKGKIFRRFPLEKKCDFFAKNA